MSLYAAVNNECIELDKACIPLSEENRRYGIGVYETLKVRAGKIFFIEEHLERLFHSADIVGLRVDVSPDTLRKRLREVVGMSGIQKHNVKIILVKKTDSSVDTYMYPSEIPWKSDHEYPEPVGLNAMIFHGERHFPQAKSLSMLLSTVALGEAQKHDCWDAVLVDRDGELCEGSRSNVYWFEGDEIYSPPTEKILSGVTRRHFIQALEMSGRQVHSGHLLLDDFYRNPRPLMLSSTSIGVQPVRQIKIISKNTAQFPPTADSTQLPPAADSGQTETIDLPSDGQAEECARCFIRYMQKIT
ncbi:MAG: aminotransferase class IV [Salinispira sp.]